MYKSHFFEFILEILTKNLMNNFFKYIFLPIIRNKIILVCKFILKNVITIFFNFTKDQ